MITKEFINILTAGITSKARQPSGRSLSSAVNRHVAFRPPPHPLQRWLLPEPGPERNLCAPLPALCRFRPSVAFCLLTKEV